MPVYAVMNSRVDNRQMWLAKANEGGAAFVRQIAPIQNISSTGLTIGFDWEPGRGILASVGDRNANQDSIFIFDLGPDIRCLSFNRNWLAVPPGEQRNFELNFNSGDLAVRAYDFSLVILHNGAADSVLIPVHFVVDPEAGIGDLAGSLPSQFELDAPYPNPFNSTTRIAYAFPAASRIRLALYDVAGREALLLAEGDRPAGRYALAVRADQLAAGLYFVRLETKAGSFTRRMVVLK